ncbi:hypothetical protein RGU70_16890 [Herbaspirillum sp. RTI4]|uniref:hypothetical protein n=1 Tax=Herbaspirillum sp. RTI4 TaxID=3048640 RepID=UPI002AB41A70|nr:hypothetical protein [Herbaspirillum sp. RTI4]MDY7579992.1 hypothetical protein [Herbaspirillum sp. RTI4]
MATFFLNLYEPLQAIKASLAFKKGLQICPKFPIHLRTNLLVDAVNKSACEIFIEKKKNLFQCSAEKSPFVVFVLEISFGF